jgi:DNA-binding transcriptional MerR regulator
MRICDLSAQTGILSAQTGIPVATIKFYLRGNLLHPGVRTAVTPAQYEQSHVARLRLIRALLGPGGLSLQQHIE